MRKLTLQEFCNTFDCYGCVDSNGQVIISESKPIIYCDKWYTFEDKQYYRLFPNASLGELININNPVVEEAYSCPNCGGFVEEVNYWELHWKESLTRPERLDEEI